MTTARACGPGHDRQVGPRITSSPAASLDLE